MCSSRCAERSRDAGNDFGGDAGPAKRFEFFPAPPENERVPALQAHYLQTHQPVLNQKAVDLFLGRALHATPFTHVEQLCAGGNHGENLGAHQVVV